MSIDDGELEGPSSTSATGELNLDPATHRAIVRAALGWRLWLLRGMGALLLVLAMASLVVVGAEALVGAALEVGLGLVLISSYALTARIGWRRLRAFTGGPWRYELSETGVRILTPVSHVSVSWEVIRRIECRSGVWLLVTTSHGRLGIPRAAFAPDEARRADELFAASLHHR